jgi:hypothetical protein
MRAKTDLVNVKLLVQSGANINAVDSIGNSFVEAAANLTQYDIVIYALEQGYKHRLPFLAWELNDRRPDGRAPVADHLEPKRAKALLMLTQRGIHPSLGS